MRVIVADDEVNVCQLICNLVDWSSFGMEIVGVAHNGVEALELVAELEPDLIVTDIRMPGCDGLEMISRARAVREDLDFVIISGHSHFEYAQRAIRYGVYDYLLKPLKKDELCETLSKMRDRYLERIKLISKEQEREKRLKGDIDRLRAGMFGQILMDQMPLSELSLESLNSNYHFNFKDGCFKMAVVKLDFPYEEHYQNVVTVLMGKIRARLAGLLGPLCYDLQLAVIGSRAYLVLNYGEDLRKDLRRQLKAALDDLLIQASMFDGIRLTIGLGKGVKEIGLLGVSLETAENSVAQRLLDGCGALLEYPGGKTSSQGAETPLPEFSRSAAAAVETLNPELLAAAAEGFEKACRAMPELCGFELFSLVKSAYHACLTHFNYYLKTGEFEKYTGRFERKADLCGSLGELFALFESELSLVMNEVLEARRQADKKPVRDAKQYINENYMRPVTLEEVSGITGFNPSYFSTLFKKESGRNFVEYLTEVRMNHAKTLLKETNMTVLAICNAVGYSDLKHFTQSFKKFTGLKPGEFRKLFS